MSEELEKAAEIAADKYYDVYYRFSETADESRLKDDFIEMFEAGAAWQKTRAFADIIKDIQTSGGILIVEPVGGVSVEPNSAGGVNFTRIKESTIIPEIPKAAFPEILEKPLKAKDFTFPFPFPGPVLPKNKKGFRGKGRKH